MKKNKFSIRNFKKVKISEPKVLKLKGGECGETTAKDPTAYASGNGNLDGRADSGDWVDTGCC